MTAYATTLELAESLFIVGKVPSRDVGETPSLELVGTGDGSASVFYLDQERILAGTYTLYYGSAEASAVEFTETTYYSLNKDTGKVTLTSGGITELSTNNIYAEYKYVKEEAKLTDSFLTKVLNRAKQLVDDTLNTTFTDGTQTNPDYPLVADERQESKGVTQNRYWTKKRPLIDVSSTLASDLSSGGTTAELNSGDGDKFPTSGRIIIESEIIDYTGRTADILTGMTRGTDGSTAATHSTDKEVHTTIVQLSGTQEGTEPVWYIQEWNKDIYIDDLGEVFLHDSRLTDNSTGDNILLPEIGVANRFKIRYLHGYDTIPDDIKRLNILFAKRALIQDNIGQSLILGRDEFNPEMVNVDNTEIQRIINAYRQNGMGNT